MTAGEFLDDGWFAIKESVNACTACGGDYELEDAGRDALDKALHIDHLALLVSGTLGAPALEYPTGGAGRYV